MPKKRGKSASSATPEKKLQSLEVIIKKKILGEAPEEHQEFFSL